MDISRHFGLNCSVISINSTTIICQFTQFPSQTGSLNATLIGQGVLIPSQENQVATIVQVSITSNSTFLPFNSSNILIEWSFGKERFDYKL